MTRPDRSLTLLLLALGLLLRALHQVQLALFDPTWGIPHGNAASFVRMARGIAAGDLLAGDEPFFYGPLYSYFLAACFALFGGETMLLPRLIQVALGLATAWLVLRAARTCFGESAAVAALALVVLSPAAIFFEGLLVASTLEAFLLALFLALALPRLPAADLAPMRWPLGGLVAAGAALGLCAWGRGNVLLLAPVFAACLLERALSTTPRALRLRALKPAAAFTAGVLAAVLPVTARNWAVSGDRVLLVSQGGLNFHVGNNPEATGVFNLPQALGVLRDGDPEYRQDAQAIAERAAGRPLRPSEASRWWTQEALAWILMRPGDAARLALHKVRLVLDDYEVPIHQNFQFYRHWSWVLRLPLPGWGVLLPLAVVGLVSTPPRRDRRGVLVVLALAYAASVVAFFVADRYRFLLLVLLAPHAGAGLVAIGRLLARRSAAPRRTGLALAAGVAVAALVQVPALDAEARARYLALEHARHGRAWTQLGHHDRAARSYAGALEAHPGHVDSRLALAEALSRAQRPREAEAVLRDWLERGPDGWRARMPLVELHLAPPPRGLGDPRRALELLEPLATGKNIEAYELQARARHALAAATAAGEPASGSPDPPGAAPPPPR